jgi:hypothetical protein
MATIDRVEVTGTDAARYLHSQLSQNVERLAVDKDAWTLLLEPNGKVVALAVVRRTAEDSFTVDTDAGFGDRLLERLMRFKIRVDADVVLQPGVDVGDRGLAGFATDDDRIAAGWPAMGSEIVPGETLPAETGVVEVAVDFTKGCYPGQELVERMDSRGAEAPRSLRIVGRGVDVPADVTVGDAVVVDGATVGVVTSVGSSEALAMIKRGHAVGRPPVGSAPIA